MTFRFKSDHSLDNFWHKAFLGFTILIAVVGSYFLSLDNGFIGDDVERIVVNNELRTLTTSMTGELADRPLLMFMMWLQATALGLGPLGMRLVGIVFHVLVSMQIFLLAKETGKERSDSNAFPAVAALAFAVHPLNSQTITIVIQQGVIFASLLGLVSLRYFLKWYDDLSRKSFLISFISFGLALLFKPIVAFLPFFYLTYTWTLGSFRSKHWKLLLLMFLPLVVPVIFYQWGKVNSQHLYSEAPLEYFLLQMEVIFTYFKLMFVPYGLQYLYDFETNSDVVFNVGWLYFLAHVLIIYLAKIFFKNVRNYLLFICFYMAFLPESSFFPIIHTAFEHRTYFPLALLFTAVGVHLKRNLEFKRKSLLFVATIIISYVGLIQIRNLQITPPLNWMEHTLENSIIHHNYNYSFTTELLKAGKWKEVWKNIDRYKEKNYGDEVQYKILLLLANFFSGKVEKNIIIDSLEDYLREPWDGVTPRVDGNLFLIKMLGSPDASLEQLLGLEDVLSMQMKIFFTSHRANYFVTVRNHYPAIAARILKQESELLQNGKIETVLKIKTILQYYYGVTATGLEEDLRAAFLANPDSKVLSRLTEMLKARTY